MLFIHREFQCACNPITAEDDIGLVKMAQADRVCVSAFLLTSAKSALHKIADRLASIFRIMPTFLPQPSSTALSRSTFVSITLSGGIMTVRPAGPNLVEREAIIIAAEVKLAMDAYGSAMRAFVLDLSDVQMMSSFGLGLCIELRNSVKAMRIPTVLFGLNQMLGDLFKMMKVDRLYTIAQTPRDLAKAIAA